MPRFPQSSRKSGKLEPAIVAAGHEGAMTDATGHLFVKKTVEPEVKFYQYVFQHDPDLAAMMPTFMGVLGETTLRSDSIGHSDMAHFAEHLTAKQPVGIVLENLTAGFTSPTVLDIKLGSVLWDDTADDSKVERLKKVSETTTSGSLGFRVAGMSVFTKGVRTPFDKMYGRSLKGNDIAQKVLEDWLPNMPPEKKAAIATSAADYMTHLHRLLSKREYRMISSSVLIVYESDAKAFGEKLDIQNGFVDGETSSLEANSAYDEDDDDDYLNGHGSTVDVHEVNQVTEEDKEDIDGVSDDDEEGNEEDEDNDEEDDDDDYDEDDDDEIIVPKPVVLAKLVDLAHASYAPGEGCDKNLLFGLSNAIDLMKRIAELAEDEE